MNDINFWDTNVEVGHYDLNFRNGLKKNKGIRTNWHKITFEEVINIKKETNNFEQTTYEYISKINLAEIILNKIILFLNKN